jgi:hypothetical protein
VPRSVTTQHATSYEAVMLCLAQGSREATTGNYEGAPFHITIHSGREGIKGGKMRFKQCLQGVMTTMIATLGRQAALTCGASRLPHAVTSVKRGHA